MFHLLAIVLHWLRPRRRQPTSDLYFSCVYKGRERYIFVYDDASRSELLRTLGRFACNKELSFDWKDAVQVSEGIR